MENEEEEKKANALTTLHTHAHAHKRFLYHPITHFVTVNMFEKKEQISNITDKIDWSMVPSFLFSVSPLTQTLTVLVAALGLHWNLRSSASYPFPYLLFCHALFFVPTLFMHYWPIRMQFPSSVTEIRMWLPARLLHGCMNKKLTETVTSTVLAWEQRSQEDPQHRLFSRDNRRPGEA